MNCISQGILSDFFRNRRREIEKVAALDFTFERREKLIARDNYEDGRNAGIEEGRVGFIVKKVKKGLDLQEIADILEEQVEDIRDIYEAVMKNAPDYDVDKIIEELK